LPTNAAVQNLGAARLQFLSDPANIDELKNILLYHILPGKTLTKDLQPGFQDTLLTGQTVLIRLNSVMFDNATVVTADNSACNGLFNVIDMVLDPALTGKYKVTPLLLPAPTEFHALFSPFSLLPIFLSHIGTDKCSDCHENSSTNESANFSANGRTHRRANGCTHGNTDDSTNEGAHDRTNENTHGRTNGRTYTGTNRRTNYSTNGSAIVGAGDGQSDNIDRQHYDKSLLHVVCFTRYRVDQQPNVHRSGGESDRVL
jgi:Fasciclin domain